MKCVDFFNIEVEYVWNEKIMSFLEKYVDFFNLDAEFFVPFLVKWVDFSN